MFDDGHALTLVSNQPLGRNIFKGGIDDGNTLIAASNQPLGRNIFTGGVDDGHTLTTSNNQPLGRNIFTGGVDDGHTLATSSNQPLGRNIFTGGVDDGWAMVFVSSLPLPITITDFNGKWQQNDALLNWQTNTEVNSSTFELERSFDGTSFVSIKSILAAGQSSIPKNYSYTDIGVKLLLPQASPIVYYRLKSLDRSGGFTYSGVVLLKASNAVHTEYAVFPNPARDIITVSANGILPDNPTYIRMADVLGKVLILEKMTSDKQQVNVANLPDGTYFLQIVGAEKAVYTQKIIIRK